MIIATAAGRLGRDAELRTTQSGTAVCKFTVACDQGFGDRKTTIWVQCVVFGDRANKLSQYLVKGLAVTVMGEAKPVFWKKSDGEPGGAIEIICDKVVLQSKSERTNEGGMYEGGGGDGPPDDGGRDLDDEIPF